MRGEERGWIWIDRQIDREIGWQTRLIGRQTEIQLYR